MNNLEEEPRPGLIASLRALLGNALGLITTRLALAALELADARDALLRLLLLSACGLLAAGFAAIFWSALLVYLSWDFMGWRILLILAFAYSLLAWWLLHRAFIILSQGQLGLPATIAELRRDREVLFDRAP